MTAAARRHATGLARGLGVALAGALLMQLWRNADLSLNRGEPTTELALDPAWALVHLSLALGVMLATRTADRAVARGADRGWAYGLAVVAGCGLGALVQGPLRQLLLTEALSVVPAPDGRRVPPPLAVFFESLMWGATGVALYATLRARWQARLRMSRLQLQRAHLQRDAVLARLQALKSRVDPAWLRDELARIRADYARDGALGARRLDALAAHLRSSLPSEGRSGARPPGPGDARGPA